MGRPGTVTQWQDGMAPDTTSATHVHVYIYLSVRSVVSPLCTLILSGANY